MSTCNNPKCWCHQMQEIEKMLEEDCTRLDKVPYDPQDAFVPVLKAMIPKDFEHRIKTSILLVYLKAIQEEMSEDDFVNLATKRIMNGLFLKKHE